MTIHREMFNNGIEEPEGDTLHRVYVEFEGGYWITLGLIKDFQEMVNTLGRPVHVEFRATDEGWISGVEGEEQPRLPDGAF